MCTCSEKEGCSECVPSGRLVMVANICDFCGAPSHRQQTSPTNRFYGTLTCHDCYGINKQKVAFALRKPHLMPADRVQGDTQSDFKVKRSSGAVSSESRQSNTIPSTPCSGILYTHPFQAYTHPFQAYTHPFQAYTHPFQAYTHPFQAYTHIFLLLQVDDGWRPTTTFEAGNSSVLCPAPLWMDANIIFFCMFKEAESTYKGVSLKVLVDLNPGWRPFLDLTNDINVMSMENIHAWEKAWADSFPSATKVLQRWWSSRPAVGLPHARERNAIAFSVLGAGVHLGFVGGLPQMPNELWGIILSFVQHTHVV
jgi:hypothetical protein